MKKHILSALIFIVSFLLFAQDADLKYCYGKQDGVQFEGYAKAEFIGTTNELFKDLPDEMINSEDFNDFIFGLVKILIETAFEKTPISELTTKNRWLCNQALSEFNFKKDDWYTVATAEEKAPNNYQVFFVKINDKNDFSWCGIEIAKDEIESLTEKFSDFDFNSLADSITENLIPPSTTRTLIIDGKTYEGEFIDYIGGMTCWYCTERYGSSEEVLLEFGYFNNNGELKDELGFVLFDGTNKGTMAIHSRDGIDHRWDWSDKREGGNNYSFIIEPDGTGIYYKFVNGAETAKPSSFYKAHKRQN